jgi:hypothetical protein
MNTKTLSEVTKWLSWFWDLERIWSLELCLGVNAIALVLNDDLRKLGCFEWRWLGVFIASNHFLAVGWLCCRWAHRTVRWCTGQTLFTVQCVPHQRACWSLELLIVGILCPFAAPDGPVAHQTCPVTSDFDALTSAWHCSSLFTFAVDRWRARSRCSTGSPDMSGAHRTVRWIIAERAHWIPESVWFVARGPSASDSVRCATWQHTLMSCSKFDCFPNWISFLVCVEPYAPKIKDI